MRFVAEHIIALLLEDRIDDLIARYPKLKLTRPKMTQWLEFDPTSNKKYFPWIVKQVALKKVKLPTGGERLRDDLMSFERLLSIPAFTEPRDIFQYDAKRLSATMRKHARITSKSQQARDERNKGVKVVGQSGNIKVVEIKNAQELMSRGWSAYTASNPNWTGKKLKLPKQGEEAEGEEAEGEWDGLWCIRFPQYAQSYLAADPFYLVYKNDGPYVGIVFKKGECQTLENEGISLGVAEEIYPAMKPILDVKAKDGLEGNCSIFVNLRFLNGEAKDGETVTGRNNRLDLANSSLSRLPNNLTVNGALDLTNCPIAQLPAGLSVKGGSLKIAGTRIDQLPIDLAITEMEWSEPLTWEEIKKQFYRMRLFEMKEHFLKSDKLTVAGKPGAAPLNDAQKEKAWINFQPELIQYFMQNPKIELNAKGVFHYVKPGSKSND